MDQHQILTDLTEHGYSGIDARSKVRYLLDGIKTTALDTVKSRIYSDETLRNDFDKSVNLFQDFIIQSSRSEPRRAGISAIGRGSGGPRSESGTELDKLEPDMSVEDRYYSKTEYSKLSAAKKKGLNIKRKKRGHKPGAKDSKSSPKKGPATFRKRVVSVLKQLTGKGELNAGDDSSDSDEEVPMKDNSSQSNRTNKALKRKNT